VLALCPIALCLLALVARAPAAAATLPDGPLGASLRLSEASLQHLTGSTSSPAPGPAPAGAGEGPLPAGVAQASGTPYVDGVSDQSLPDWDGSFARGYFAGFFRDTWTSGLSAHIAFARYVVQWNVLSGAYPVYLAELEAWYTDVLELGLTPELSLASYDGVLPSEPAAYRASLAALLSRFPAIRYLEAWDEPNATGLSPATAAAYTDSAAALCAEHGCAVIAGNLLDSPGMLAYERAYERGLAPGRFVNWGVHPYHAVKARDPRTVLAFRSNLPAGGAGARIWFTEIGAYRCEDGARYEPFGERAQALDASWLVNRLMPAIQPVHVFYYETLFKNGLPPPCDPSDADTALYVPSADPNAPDAPRAAASYIYGDRGFPIAYTGAGSAGVTTGGWAVLTASVYPGGFFDAHYRFEYGLTAAYGSSSTVGDAGSGLGRVQARALIGGLRPGAAYHFRIVVWNVEGASYGADRTFTANAFDPASG
jgi:hypothetical protein